MDLGLDGKVALVTGASRGTGAGLARVLAAEGADVLVHGFDPEPTEAVVAGIRVDGGRARAVVGDIRTDAGAEAVADACGPVDVLVNNYGVAEGGGWFDDDMGPAAWIDQYEKNVLSAVRMIRLLVPGMRERGWGRVVVVATVGTARPGERLPHYYTAKAGLPALATSLAKELTGTGITVNCVSPGLIATAEVLDRAARRAAGQGRPTDPEALDRFLVDDASWPIPTGRVARPTDIGDLVAFLASDRAWYVNGAELRIDGGSAR